MLRFGEKKVTKEKFYVSKKIIKNWDVNIAHKVSSKLVRKKTNPKYLTGYLDKAIRLLVSIMPKKSGYLKLKMEIKIKTIN